MRIVLSLPLTGNKELSKGLVFAAHDALALRADGASPRVSMVILDNENAADPDPSAYKISDIAHTKECMIYLLARGNLSKELPVLNRAGIPVVDLTARPVGVTRDRRTSLFPTGQWSLVNVIASDEQYWRAIHDWLLAREAQGYILAFEESGWGSRFADYLRNHADVSPSIAVSLASTCENAESVVRALKTARAGTVCLIVESSKLAAACIRALAKEGSSPVILIDAACIDADVVGAIREGGAGGNVHFLGAEIPKDSWSEEGRAFHDRFEKALGAKPSLQSIAVWNGVRVALRCIEAAGSSDRSKVTRALFAEEFEGSFGPFRFWPDGELNPPSFGLYQVGGKGPKFLRVVH